MAAGPLVVVPDAENPLALLCGLVLETDGVPVRLRVFESNERAAALWSLSGLTVEPGICRMVLGSSDQLGNSPFCWAVGSPAKD